MILVLVALLAATAQPIMTLTTGGGGPGGARFVVKLSASGRLHVAKESLPMTPSGFTRRTLDRRLSPAARDEIVRLATAADDFDRDCRGIVDGTNASLVVRGVQRTCSGGGAWPAGPRTKRLLRAINRHLPEAMQVY